MPCVVFGRDIVHPLFWRSYRDLGAVKSLKAAVQQAHMTSGVRPEVVVWQLVPAF